MDPLSRRGWTGQDEEWDWGDRGDGPRAAGRAIALPATFVLARGTGQVVSRYIGETALDRPQTDAILAAVDRAGAGAIPATAGNR